MNEFVIKNGLIVESGTTTVTGSVTATGGFTGSLLGTASVAISLAGGALTNFIEGFSSATQATSFLSASNAAATVNIAIVPKGSGSLIAAVPDGTAVGGNARGAFAIDLQLTRSLATQVASGPFSIIGGGLNNRISSTRSNSNCVIAGGSGNTISQLFSATIVGGDGNTIGDNDGWQCTILGGSTNTITARLAATILAGNSNTISTGGDFATVGGRANGASGESAAIIGGRQNTAAGTYSTVCGGYVNTAGSSNDFVGGGDSNTTGGSDNSFNKFIGGGGNNSVNGSQTSYSGIACGQYNSIPNGRFSFIGGGASNTIFTPWYSFIGGGQNNYLDGNNGNSSHQAILGGSDNRTFGSLSAIIGGAQAYTSLYGQIAHASGQFSVRGDAQAHELVWRRLITGAPIGGTELFLNGSSAAAILPSTNAIWHGIIDIAAICTATGNGTTVTGDVEATSYKVTIKRIGTTTSLVGTVQEIGTINADASMASGVFTIDNNDTNESLRIVYTSPTTAGSTTTIRVVATFRGIQIQY